MSKPKVTVTIFNNDIELKTQVSLWRFIINLENFTETVNVIEGGFKNIYEFDHEHDAKRLCDFLKGINAALPQQTFLGYAKENF